MGRELTHLEAADLLGVYALDALDDDEREAVDRHVAGCRLCEVEVTEHREVASLLTAGIDRPPDGLWDRISESLEDVPPPLVLPVRPVPAATITPRRSAGLRVAAMVAAVAAVGIIGVLGYRVVDDGRRIDEITAGARIDDLEGAVDAAMADPDAARVELKSSDGQLFADAWVLPDGRAYLAADNLPALPAGRGYQLWALTGADSGAGQTPVSVGLLGPDPGRSAFRATGPVRGFAITDEPVAGVSTPSQAPLVAGLLAGG